MSYVLLKREDECYIMQLLGVYSYIFCMIDIKCYRIYSNYISSSIKYKWGKDNKNINCIHHCAQLLIACLQK